MNTAAIAHCTPARAAELLADLETAHAAVLGAVSEMESATLAAQPDPSRYPHARWKLSRASRNRRTLVTTICSYLLKGRSGPEVKTLELLQAEGTRALQESSGHVRTWTLENIAANWPEYCQASARIRESMKDRIAAEKRILYPLLKKLAG